MDNVHKTTIWNHTATFSLPTDRITNVTGQGEQGNRDGVDGAGLRGAGLEVVANATY